MLINIRICVKMIHGKYNLFVIKNDEGNPGPLFCRRISYVDNWKGKVIEYNLNKKLEMEPVNHNFLHIKIGVTVGPGPIVVERFVLPKEAGDAGSWRTKHLGYVSVVYAVQVYSQNLIECDTRNISGNYPIKSLFIFCCYRIISDRYILITNIYDYVQFQKFFRYTLCSWCAFVCRELGEYLFKAFSYARGYMSSVKIYRNLICIQYDLHMVLSLKRIAVKKFFKVGIRLKYTSVIALRFVGSCAKRKLVGIFLACVKIPISNFVLEVTFNNARLEFAIQLFWGVVQLNGR